jgi:peptidoglycan-associated lipoprotein
MKNNPEKHVLTEGHCDERGSNEYNLALGEQRALGVRQFLTDQGIEASKVQTISYGEEKPLASGQDESAWKQTRRAHFLISGEGVSTGS